MQVNRQGTLLPTAKPRHAQTGEHCEMRHKCIMKMYFQHVISGPLVVLLDLMAK